MGQPPLPRRDRALVVVLDHVARLSGGEIALARLVPALINAVDVHVVLGEDGPLVERLRAGGATVEVLPMAAGARNASRRAVRASMPPVREAWQTLRYVVRLRRRLRELQPDLVHTNSLKAALYGGLAGRLAGVPVVWHIRDRIADDYLPLAAVRLVRGLARVLPSATIANSRATLATLPRVRGGAVVYDSTAPMGGMRHSVPEGRLVFGVVGRLAEWKGQHVFLEAFAKAFSGTEHRARLIGSAMFGEEVYEKQLREQANVLGIADQVELTGFRHDVEAVYRGLDVLVHCSVTPEPFGQVVVEGMAAGLAVVAAAAGGPLEIVEPEVDGLLVLPDDPVVLAAALRRLEGDRVLLQRLGEQAADKARLFSPQATAAGVLEVYRQVRLVTALPGS